jgi:hypothetical protein
MPSISLQSWINWEPPMDWMKPLQKILLRESPNYSSQALLGERNRRDARHAVQILSPAKNSARIAVNDYKNEYKISSSTSVLACLPV